MVQGGVIVERAAISPASSPPLHAKESRSSSFSSECSYKKENCANRMSIERSDDEEMGSRGSSGKTPSPSMDTSSPPSSQMNVDSSPKTTSDPCLSGFSSSALTDEQHPFHKRRRAVLDLNSASAFTRKVISNGADAAAAPRERSSSFTRSVVPAYSPMSSSASTSSGSPSATPEATKMDEVSIHDVAKEVTDRRSQPNALQSCASGTSQIASTNVAPTAAAPEFDLPKNFYGYYVYQLELASRYSSSLRNNGPDSRTSAPLVGKVKPTMKSDLKDDEVVSYGSLLEQALRNGLKRSPSDIPAGFLEKKLKSGSSSGAPSPASQPSPPSSQNSRHSSASQVSVEDVAKNSMREMMNNRKNSPNGSGCSSQGSRSSSPSVHLKSLLETQQKCDGQLKNQQYRTAADLMAMTFAGGFQRPPVHGSLVGGKIPTPHIYPHVLTRPGSPQPANQFASHGPSAAPSAFTPSGYKHKKLIDWTSSDVRDWISSLNYCSEFAEVFARESVDGVALTLLNETHLMKNFGMKLGPAIKLRCAVWEILGLSQAQGMQAMQPHMPMAPHAFLPQKPIAVGHCMPHAGAVGK